MKPRAGVDASFPYLAETERYPFPDPSGVPDDLVAAGGNLSPGMLLSAYENGIFPWYDESQPVLWQSPLRRFVLYPQDLHVAQSMRKVLRQRRFEIRYNSAFAAVIQNCAAAARGGQNGTWITGDMIRAYCRLRELGYAHSAEAWRDGELCGGCYGVLLPKRQIEPDGAPPRTGIFFGESMFSRASNASKAAFLQLAGDLFSGGVRLIDCQVWSRHLESLGAREISRARFLAELHAILG
jgi:leucyl/phenylalanyl-tRNA--protein transferase